MAETNLHQVVGGNGTGKTRVLQRVSRRANAHSRGGPFFGRPSEIHPRLATYSYLPQAVDRLSVSARAAAVLEVPQIVSGCRPEEAQRNAQELLERLGVHPLVYEQDINSLSGG